MSTTPPAPSPSPIQALVNPPAPADPAATTPPVTPPAATWTDTLPEAYRSNEAITNLGSLDALLQDYTGLKTTLATNPDQFPGFDADYTQHKDFFQKLGVPETPEQYDLPSVKELGENVDKGRLDAILKAAHEAKTPQALLDKIIQADVAYTEQRAQQVEVEVAEQVSAMEKALTDQWGNNTDAYIKAIDTALSKFGSKETKELFKENLHVFLHPSVQNMLLAIGQAITEQPSPGASSTAGGVISTAEQASTELQRFMMDEKNRVAYRSPIDPSHRQVVEYVTNLYQRGAKLRS